MPGDHKKSNMELILHNMQGLSNKINQFQDSLDNIFHHIAAFARKMEISPEDLVKLIHDTAPNYKFLADCMKAEQVLQKQMRESFAEANKVNVSEETKATVNELSDGLKETLNENESINETNIPAPQEQGKDQANE